MKPRLLSLIVIVGEMIAIRDNVQKINDVDYESIIGEFVNNNIANMLSIKEDKVTMEPRGPLLIRAEIDEGLIYISKPAFRKFLIESNISTKEFLFQMKKQGVDIEQRKKRMGAGWKDATGALNIDTFVIPTSAFNKELFD